MFQNIFDVQNPYMRLSSVFVGRKDVFVAVGRVLRDPNENAILLYGQRGIGKTAILRELTAGLPKTGCYLSVYFELAGKAAQPLSWVVEELAGKIATVLGLPSPELGLNPEYTFRHIWLPEVLQKLPQGIASLVILLDEFDGLDYPNGDQAAVTLYPYLCGLLSNAGPRLKFIFTLGRHEKDLQDISHSIFKTIPAKRLSLLEQDQTVDLMLKVANNSIKWSQDALNHVWMFTHGHPLLTRLLCASIWQRAYTQWMNSVQYSGLGIPAVTTRDVEVAIHEFQDSGKDELEWIWNSLSPLSQAVLMALVQTASDDTFSRSVSQSNPALGLLDGGVIASTEEYQTTLERLRDLDMIETSDGDRYTVLIELFRRWLVTRKQMSVPSRTAGEPAYAEENSSLQSASDFHSKGQSAQVVKLLYQTSQSHQDDQTARELLDGILLSMDAGEAVDILENLFGVTSLDRTDPDAIMQGKGTALAEPHSQGFELDDLKVSPQRHSQPLVNVNNDDLPQTRILDTVLDDPWPEQITILQTQLEAERKSHLETRFNAERESSRSWEQFNTETTSLKEQLETERQAHIQLKSQTNEEFQQLRALMAFEMAVLQGQLDIARRENEEIKSIAVQAGLEMNGYQQPETISLQADNKKAAYSGDNEAWTPSRSQNRSSVSMSNHYVDPNRAHKKKSQIQPSVRMVSLLVLCLIGFLSLGMMAGLMAKQGLVPAGRMAEIFADLGLAIQDTGDGIAFPLPASPPSSTQLPANAVNLDGNVTDMAISFTRSKTDQGNILAVVKTGRIYVYSQENMKQLWVSPEGERYTSVGFSPSGKFLAAGSQEHQVILWDAVNGKELHIFSGHSADINSVAFSADGRLLASGSIDTTVIVWDMNAVSGNNQSNSGRLYTFQGHTKPVKSVAFSPTGYMLASASDDNTAVIWDISSALASENKLSVSHRVLEGHTRLINQVAFSPDGKVLATCSNDRTVILWDIASGKRLNVLAGYNMPVVSVAFSQDGNLLATGLDNNMIALWDVSAVLEPGSSSASGLGVFTMLDSSGPTMRDQTLENGEQPRPAKGQSNPVWGIVFSPDGRTLTSVSQDGKLIFWSIKP